MFNTVKILKFRSKKFVPVSGSGKGCKMLSGGRARQLFVRASSGIAALAGAHVVIPLYFNGAVAEVIRLQKLADLFFCGYQI